MSATISQSSLAFAFSFNEGGWITPTDGTSTSTTLSLPQHLSTEAGPQVPETRVTIGRDPASALAFGRSLEDGDARMRGSNSASTSLAPDRFDDSVSRYTRPASRRQNRLPTGLRTKYVRVKKPRLPPPVRVVLYEYDGFWATLTAHVAQSWKSGSFLGRRVVLLTQNIDRRRSKGSGYVARVVKDGRWAGHGPSRLRNEFIPSQSYLDSDVDEDFTYEHKIVYFLESDSDSDISDASLGFDFSDESDDTRSTAVSEEDKFCNDSGSFDSPMRPATPTPYDNDSDDDNYSPALETSTMEVDEINGLFRDDDLMDYDVLDPQLIYGDGARF